VTYRRPAEPFVPPIPREISGLPVESWLGERQRGRSRNVATLGRAVRALSEEDFERILRLAMFSPQIQESTYPILEDHSEPLVASRERVERLMSAYERRAAFRREVLDAYAYRCAVTGLGLGQIAPTKSQGLLDAAHIRPVGSKWRRLRFERVGPHSHRPPFIRSRAVHRPVRGQPVVCGHLTSVGSGNGRGRGSSRELGRPRWGPAPASESADIEAASGSGAIPPAIRRPEAVGSLAIR